MTDREMIAVFHYDDGGSNRLGAEPYRYAEEIIRCKDCKWADWYKTADGEQFCYCMETGNGGRIDDDFCSFGERKESE